MLPARRLDQKPTEEEKLMQENLLKNTPKFNGFGIPKEVVPPKKPDKPADLDPEVHEWLNSVAPASPPLPAPPE